MKPAEVRQILKTWPNDIVIIGGMRLPESYRKFHLEISYSQGRVRHVEYISKVP